MEKRAARSFEDKADEELTSKDKVVYKYREERTKQWASSSRTTNLSEQEYYEQYDEEQLTGVKESIANLNKRAMALPDKVVARVSQGFLSLLSSGNNQEMHTHQKLSFYLSPDS
jgi:hypothetical protein